MGHPVYKRQYPNKHILTLSKCMCMRASELRKFWHFHILKLLFLSIFCWYIENKSWFNFIWGGGGKRPPPPSPPTSTPVPLGQFPTRITLHQDNSPLRQFPTRTTQYQDIYSPGQLPTRTSEELS